jgi:toxin ParE1/3/4
MRRLVLGRAANRDLEAILRYVATQADDPRYGFAIADALLAQCEKLAGLPGTLGRPRPELAPALRSFPFRGYVIYFFYPDDETFKVVNVLSAKQDSDDFPFDIEDLLE